MTLLLRFSSMMSSTAAFCRKEQYSVFV